MTGEAARNWVKQRSKDIRLMDGNQAEGHLSFPFSKAMRSLSRSFAPSSVLEHHRLQAGLA